MWRVIAMNQSDKVTIVKRRSQEEEEFGRADLTGILAEAGHGGKI